MNAAAKKELRALLPIWAACVVTLACGALQQRGILVDLSVAAFVLGPALLAAHAVGQEYAYRTLPMLLAQPADRRRVFATKWLLAFVMACTITGVAWLVLGRHARGMWEHWNVMVLPLVGGLFMAPYLALLLRSTLAGVLATGTVFSLGLLVPTIGIALTRGISADAAQEIALATWSAAMMALSIAAGVLAVGQFARLEAGDFTPRAFTLPHLGATRARRFRPIAALAGKEVQLQHLSITLAAIFIAAALVLIVLQRTVTWWSSVPMAALLSIYCVSLSLVVGAMASAEERQLGVADWQLIQPVSLPAQWAIKVAVIMALSIVLAALLPALLMTLATNPGDTLPWRMLLLPAIFLTAGGLYLSSLTSAGTWALVLALPAGGAALLFVSVLDGGLLVITGQPFTPIAPLRPILWTLVQLLLALAYLNHTAGRRPAVGVAAQVTTLAAVIALTRYIALTLYAPR